jgi:hypothetical protein
MLTRNPSDPISPSLEPEPAGPIAGTPGACSGPLPPAAGGHFPVPPLGHRST